MSSSEQLFYRATLKAQRADRCFSVADVLDRRRFVLVDRHEPVVALHRVEVWRGRAATASRNRLRHVIGATLYSLGSDLANISGALRSEASKLESEAAALRRQALAVAEAEARAAARAAAEAAANRAAQTRSGPLNLPTRPR